MKKDVCKALLCMGLLPGMAQAQVVELDSTFVDEDPLEKDIDYSVRQLSAAEIEALPDHVNNGYSKFFPPVFNQSGGSCSAASRIGYMFTHEMNAYRDADGKKMENRYPSHFVWLTEKANTGKYGITQKVGVPNANVYGGVTFSHKFGNQTPYQNNWGWMQGYDKWYSAMFNRILMPRHLPSLKTEEGRIALKRWLYNHNGDPDFYGGGVAGVGVGINGYWGKIPESPTNNEIGVTGKKYVVNWGPKFNHALTIVGYDDRIEFDLNKNGIYGEASADEKGAWILVNSWGARFANNGFIYCPYAKAVKTKAGTSWWFPEIFNVRKNYQPARTIKVKMNYSHRSEMCLRVGISNNINDTVPQKIMTLDHFEYAGDGHNGSTNPAPGIPMLGKWADGKLHSEPMEFGYDLTDFSNEFDTNVPLKYFFIIDTRDWAKGTGKVFNASIIDYAFAAAGAEVPFLIAPEGVEVQNQGKRTILSTVVSGTNYFAPQNVAVNGQQLAWTAPLGSAHPVEGYCIYADNVEIGRVPADVTTWDISKNTDAVTFAVSTRYAGQHESGKTSVAAPISAQQDNTLIQLAHSGFSVPTIFDEKYEEATIEFWIRPKSFVDYNQGGGPGWNKFKFHSNAAGAFVVGWDTENRLTTPGVLKANTWTHIAIVVKGSHLEFYKDGKKLNEMTSATYSGIGKFGEFPFGTEKNENNLDADMDEVRIWNYAKTAEEVSRNMNTAYAGPVMPSGLMAYFKGGLMTENEETFLIDYAGGHHAKMLTATFEEVKSDQTWGQPSGEGSLEILPPTEKIYCGLPVKFAAKYSDAVTHLSWTSAHLQNAPVYGSTPMLTFTEVGEQQLTATATLADGTTLQQQCPVKVENAVAASAAFHANKANITPGEQVTFVPDELLMGYKYEWSLPGSRVESAVTPMASTSYAQGGTYSVTLTVTFPDGRQAVEKKSIKVAESCPEADFTITPSVIVKGGATVLKDNSKYGPTTWLWEVSSPGKTYIVKGQHSTFVPEIPGVYDVSLTVKNGAGRDRLTQKRGLTVCNADSENGLLFTSAESAVKLSKALFSTPAAAATFEWWLNPSTLKTSCNGLGEEGSWMMKTNASGAMTVSVGGSAITSPNGFVLASEWHHYAVTFDKGTITFYRDGKLHSTATVTATQMPVVKFFKMGGTAAPIDGQIDEFRIWNKALSQNEIQQYANAPIADVQQAIADHQLTVYYDFNQGGGNVTDRTGNGYEGTRIEFGPDGDAWGLSEGVFCLNFDEAAVKVTDQYLKNYTKPFAYHPDQVVNPADQTRFFAIQSWNLENATVNGEVITGVYVDLQKQACFTYTTGWDNFGSLKNHKAFQTLTLPAGKYTFTAKYDADANLSGQAGKSYLVVAQGDTLPDTEQLDNAIAAVEMTSKPQVMENTLTFVLTAETPVALGMLINQEGKNLCALSAFDLYYENPTVIDADGKKNFELTTDKEGLHPMYLSYTSVIPAGVTAYAATAVENDHVVLEPVAKAGELLAKETAVVLHVAQPQDNKAHTYVFEMSNEKGNQPEVNLLKGNATQQCIAPAKGKVAYVPGMVNDEMQLVKATLNKNGQGEAGTTHFESAANSIYMEMVQAAEDASAYRLLLKDDATAIEHLEWEGTNHTIYDLQGKTVSSTPVAGTYIVNGKKIYLK